MLGAVVTESTDSRRPAAERTAGPKTLGVGIGLAVLYAGWRMAIDLDPPSLWIDDAWVVVLARAPAYGWALVQPASAPPLFMLLVGAATAISPDLELGAQAWPFAAALLAVPATALLALRVTGRPLPAVIAGMVVALDTGLLVYGARVKPYSGDVLFVALQGIAFHAVLERDTPRRITGYVATCLLAFCASTYSLLVAAATAPCLFLSLVRRRGVRRDHVVAASALAAAAAVLAIRIAARPRFSQLAAFWSSHHLPSDDAAALVRGVVGWGWTWVGRLAHTTGPGAGPIDERVMTSAVATLLVAGCVELWRSGRRVELGAGVAVCACAVVASAAGFVPVGTVRGDLYLLPFAAVLIASGAGGLAHAAARLDPRPAARIPAASLTSGAVACLLAVQGFEPPTSRYPDQPAAPLVRTLEQEWRDGDALAVNLHGTFGLAVYTTWPLRFVDDGRMAIPHPEPVVDGFVIVDGEDPSRIARLPIGTRRTWALLCHDRPELRRALLDGMARAGYAIRHERAAPGCGLWLLERDDGVGDGPVT
jgi:hypothetical protein